MLRPMSRIETIFADRRAAGRRALMPFITAGYPSMAHTAALLPALERAGASICELGFPFSDPIADGPVIQASMTDALQTGSSPSRTFEMVADVRSRVNLGLVAMVSYSIVYRSGASDFVRRAKEAGIDGFIFPDLPLEEAAELSDIVRDAGLVSALLIAPTTPPDRAAKIVAHCSGFVYVVARTGITGEQEKAPEGLAERVAQLRQHTDLPIAVGFGIANAAHVRAVIEHADAAIVGSAIVRKITEHREAPPEQCAAEVGRFVADLATGLTTD